MKITDLAIGLFLGLGTAALVPACEQSCTEIGCASELVMQVRLHPDFDASAFTLSVQLDDLSPIEFACEQGAAPSCTPGVAGGVQLAFVEGDAGLIDLRVVDATPDTAASIRVLVSNGALESGEATHTPAYTASQPNGPGCPPTCYQATGAELTLDFSGPL